MVGGFYKTILLGSAHVAFPWLENRPFPSTSSSAFVCRTLPHLHSHLHRPLLNQRHDRELVKIHALLWLLDEVESPQQSRHQKAHFDPCERPSQTAVESDTKRLAGGQIVVVIFGRPFPFREPPFWYEGVRFVEVFGRAVDGKCADADACLDGSSAVFAIRAITRGMRYPSWKKDP